MQTYTFCALVYSSLIFYCPEAVDKVALWLNLVQEQYSLTTWIYLSQVTPRRYY